MDKRLLTCAKLCRGRVICDVGTDHAYLPCYMIENDLCDKAYACDVAEMPLSYAQKHIRQRNLESRITAVLSDGLDDVEKSDITDVIMAGMGGELICHLIEKCDWIKDSGITLVLQPMTKTEVLRKWLYENSFTVLNELACHEGQFSYCVMQVIFGKAKYECSDEYLHYGFVEDSYPEGLEYLKLQAKRLRTAGAGMMKSPDKLELGRKLLQLGEKYQ